MAKANQIQMTVKTVLPNAEFICTNIEPKMEYADGKATDRVKHYEVRVVAIGANFADFEVIAQKICNNLKKFDTDTLANMNNSENGWCYVSLSPEANLKLYTDKLEGFNGGGSYSKQRWGIVCESVELVKG